MTDMRHLLPRLLRRRQTFCFHRVEMAVLGLYTLLAGWLVYVHEPWADESQSWLIARDSGLGEMFFKRLHYEGTPGLWHLFLWICAHLHLSFTAMHWATALIGTVTVYVLLRYSPFPSVIRVMLPFTFALLYQTSIIARSYGFVPLLVFLICIQIAAERKRPWLFASLIGLLANTALIGFLLAISLVPFYVLRPGNEKANVELHRLWRPAALLAGLLLFAVYTAVPAPDCDFGRGAGFSSHPAIAKVLSVVTQVPVPPLSAQPVSHVAPETVSAPPLPYAYEQMLWKLDHRFAPHSPGSVLLNAGLSIASIAFFPVSSSNLLALVFYGLLLFWLWRVRAIVCLLPLVVVICGGYLLGFSEHHTSVFWSALLAVLWLAWAGIPSVERTKPGSAFLLVFVVVLLEQIAWTGFAAVYDTGSAFDGSQAAARFLLPLEGHSTVFGYGYHSISPQPYAARNLYGNQSSTYWPWSSTVDTDREITQTLKQHPAYVMAGEAYTGDVRWANQILPRDRAWAQDDKYDISGYLLAHGYHETHRFCGMQPAHFGFSEKVCEVIYQPVSPVATAN